MLVVFCTAIAVSLIPGSGTWPNKSLIVKRLTHLGLACGIACVVITLHDAGVTPEVLDSVVKLFADSG